MSLAEREDYIPHTLTPTLSPRDRELLNLPPRRDRTPQLGFGAGDGAVFQGTRGSGAEEEEGQRPRDGREGKSGRRQESPPTFVGADSRPRPVKLFLARDMDKKPLDA